MFALDDVETADAGPDVDSDAIRNLGRDLQTRGFHGFIRRRQGQVNEASHLL